MESNNIVITLACTKSGQMESIPIDNLETTTIQTLVEYSQAVFGLQGEIVILKDGERLTNLNTIVNGDVLAVQEKKTPKQPTNNRQQQTSGGLDFSNLLATSGGGPTAMDVSPTAAAAPSSGLDFSSILTEAAPALRSGAGPGAPSVYYPGMNLNDAIGYNPHPNTFMSLLYEHDHLLKELNYHNPSLATKIRTVKPDIEAGAKIWREEMFKGGIQGALSKTLKYHKEQEFHRRLKANPNDEEAKQYFKEQENSAKVEEQYRQMMQEFPESMGRVLMLYINAKINDTPIQAFVDSGAQTTIMSKSSAQQCGLLDYLDVRFAGVAVGVGTGKILGRVHMVQLKINEYYFPCTVTIMDDTDTDKGQKMEFLLGLDMLKRHTCSIDLENQVLKFRLDIGKYMETPFLHEYDLDESKGGTKGFNAERSNQELEESNRKYEQQEEEQQQQKRKSTEDDKKKE